MINCRSMHLSGPYEEAPERLSDALRRLLSEAGGRSLRVREMIEILRGRGLQMMVIVLCLPFLSPVTIPGISLPFGMAIALCGLRIAFGHKPWLPRFILEREVSHQALERMVRFGCAIYGKIERIVRPRGGFLFSGPGMGTLIGLSIALAGVLLSLPIPPPFPLTNTLPGFALIFLALGLMERDGVLILVGYFLTALATAYVGIIVLAGREGVMQLWRLLGWG
ncbi:MAG TPA: exopolysaccharide biosynthesis protein [Terrimicrobiaceae bacterium]|nr:exopolysaccharide biosynthesis protein [Terrimicrobiaceae bacterium]